MNKYLFAMSLLVTPIIALAAQCPAHSDWQSQNGFLTLNKNLEQEGWRVLQLKNISPKEISRSTNLTINLLPHAVECIYQVNLNGDTVVAYQERAVDLKYISTPPYRRAFIGYICDTFAGYANVCTWNWQS